MEGYLAQILNKLFPKSVEGITTASVYTKNERLTAAFSYFYFVSAAVLLFSMSNSPFIKLHAKHAFLFLVIAILTLLLPGNWRWVGFGVVTIFDFVFAVIAIQGRLLVVPILSEILKEFEV